MNLIKFLNMNPTNAVQYVKEVIGESEFRTGGGKASNTGVSEDWQESKVAKTDSKGMHASSATILSFSSIRLTSFQ